MRHLDRMADRPAIDAPRQLGEKRREIVFLEFLARVELPKDRSELFFNSSTPLAKKRSIDSPASASTRRWVANRGPLTENTKSSGVSAAHFRKLSGFWVA